jgi:hypothetical protein
VFKKLSNIAKPENKISMAQNILSSLSFEEKLYLYLLKVNQL